MGSTIAIMVTCTTYGTWLRGDQRGYVERGRVLPADPDFEAADKRRMKHPVFTFRPNQLMEVGDHVGKSLHERLEVRIGALTVQTWHLHIVVGATPHPLPDVVRCLKEAVRYGLRPGRPIWTARYDRRFCFDAASAVSRIEYVRKHNLERGLPADPWGFCVPLG